MNGVDHANAASEPIPKDQRSSPGEARQPRREDLTNGSGDAKDITSDEEEEREELEAEVHDLKTDKFYHDFLSAVVQHKEILDESLTADPAFVVDEPEQVEAKEEDDEDSDSTLTDAEEFEDALENADEETKIPKEALEEAQKRFPNFWRFKHALNTEYREGEYKEDLDPDYKPDKDADAVDLDDTQDEEEFIPFDPNNGNLPDSTTEGAGDEEWRQQPEEVELEEEDEKEDELEDDDDGEDMTAEVTALQAEMHKDLKSDINGLVDMVEYMTVVASEGNDAAAAAAAEGDEEQGDEMEEEEQGQTILEVDVEGYASGEDPDFVVAQDVLDHASDSDIHTDDEGESGDTKME